MIHILNKYCNSDSGLLLFNPPTGSGKTHSVLSWIYENYKEYCKENRKIFFITNLKKNLPYDELRNDFFKPDKKTLDFEKYVTFLDSNSESLINNFSEVEDSINDYFKNQKIYYTIKNRVSEINKYKNKSDFKGYVENIKDELRTKYEPDFRRRIEKFLKENFSNKQERISAITNNDELKWIGILYPAVFSSKRKIFFLSIDKFYHKNSTLVEPSYSFLEHDITKDAVIFIDEFDATKDNILNNIIEKGKNQRIDFIHLFTEIYWALSNNVFPQQFTLHSEKREKLVENGYALDLKNIQETSLEKANEIVDKYRLKYSFKTVGLEDHNHSQRNLLFHDFHYHSVYRNNKKFIKLNENTVSKINEIVFEDIRPVTGKNIVSLLNQIKGFINYFSGIIKSLGENFQQLEEQERIKNPRRPEFTFDHALSSVLEEFALESRYKRYIIDNILSARERTTKKPSGDYELNYDLSIYENGFRYYDFVDDDSHKSKTKTFIYNFQNTPEKFILKLAEKSKVVGISATALIETVTGNYDINYFKRQLGEKFIELTNDEKNSLQTLFQKQNKHYDQVNILTEWFEFKGIIDDFKDLFEDDELGKDIYNEIKSNNPNITEYLFIRYLKIGHSFKAFLKNETIQGFLCLLNKEPKWNDKNLNLKILEKIFDYLIVDTTETSNLFESENRDGELEFKVKNSYAIITSNDFDNKKQSFIRRLENGSKVFIISTYQTMGAGQNLQYIAPNPDSKVNVRDSSLTVWNTSNKTDINAIYLDKPTHLIQNISKDLNEEGFIKYLFQLEFLLQAGKISIQQLNQQVSVSFKYLLASFNTTTELEKPNNGYLYRDKNIKQHFAKYIIQAIGRICRTNLKSPDIFVFADIDLDKLICDFDVENNLVLNEFKALVKSSKHKKSTDPNNDKALKNQANLTNRKIHAMIKKFISHDWIWREKQKEEWEHLRKMCLTFPTISIQDVEKHKLNRILDLYIELPSEKNSYSYSQEEDFNDITVDFEGNLPYKVSQESARLDDLMKITGVQAFFENNGWATSFVANRFILPPELFNNIYKGALGEQIGKFIFENHFDIELAELELVNYELFDYQIKGTNVFVDFKHWQENTQIGYDEQETKIRQKLKKVNGEKVFIVNILASSKRQLIKSADGKIIEIPFLWNDEKKEFNNDGLKFLRLDEPV